MFGGSTELAEQSHGTARRPAAKLLPFEHNHAKATRRQLHGGAQSRHAATVDDAVERVHDIPHDPLIRPIGNGAHTLA